MNYSLAKELKEASFPQKGKGEVILAPRDIDWKPATETAYLPTLEELIEECVPGKADDFGMSFEGDRWHAWYFYVGYFDHNVRFKETDDSFTVDLNVYGEKPTIAVARLWLALNKI